MNDIRMLGLFLVWCKEVCCSWGSKQEPNPIWDHVFSTLKCMTEFLCISCKWRFCYILRKDIIENF